MIRSNLLRFFLALFAVSQLAGTPAIGAPPEGKGKGKPEKTMKHEGGDDRDVLVSASISFEQARNLAVTNKYTGYSSLPPGIRKNLGRGKPLPPGIAKKNVPAPLLAQLPRHPGHEWQICGSDLVLVVVATSIIADVLIGVFD